MKNASALMPVVMSVLEHQLQGVNEDGVPIETGYVRETLARLAPIHGDAEARRLMAEVLLAGILSAMKTQQPFDQVRYRRELEALS